MGDYFLNYAYVTSEMHKNLDTIIEILITSLFHLGRSIIENLTLSFIKCIRSISTMIMIITFDSTNAKLVPINLINIHDIPLKAYSSINIKSTAWHIKIASPGNFSYIRVNTIWFVKNEFIVCPEISTNKDRNLRSTIWEKK